MSYEFKIGQKVACVNAKSEPHRGETCPVEGAVYTIREIFPWPFKTHNHLNGVLIETGLYLMEIVNHPVAYLSGPPTEAPWPALCFRPLVSDTQPWLKEILTTPPKTRVLSDDNVKNLLAKIFDSVAKPQ